jgi:aminoglycoside phosphotransferase (APT) family kinase protein
MLMEPEEIDVERVTQWFVAHVSPLATPLTFGLIAGGRSNLTYRVEDIDGRAWVLRRPPIRHVLTTAHDVAREYQIMSALKSTAVPVPKTIGLSADGGDHFPFLVMEFVDGHILRTISDAEDSFARSIRMTVGRRMAEVLATLHAIGPDDVGLAQLGRHGGYLERQLKRWSMQYEQMQLESTHHRDVVLRVRDELASRIPVQQRTSIVHGDYRLDNVVLSDDGSVCAVLDWELCTLGDPLADLGLLLVYWTGPEDEISVLGQAPTAAPGFAGRTKVLDDYANLSNLDLSDIAYYMAFGYWKLACILQGVYARYEGGARAGDSRSVKRLPEQVKWLAQTAADTLGPRR